MPIVDLQDPEYPLGLEINKLMPGGVILIVFRSCWCIFGMLAGFSGSQGDGISLIGHGFG